MSFQYEVFDHDPGASGPCGWDVDEWGWPDPDDYDDAETLLADVLAYAVSEAADLGYEPGERMWAQVTDVESDVIVASGSRLV